MNKLTTEQRMKQAERWSGMVEREMIRVGVENAYAAADWLSGTNDGLDVELTVGYEGNDPHVELMAIWGPQEEGNHAMADLQLGWPKRRMIAELRAIKKEYEDWLFHQGQAANASALTACLPLAKG